jgi:cytochrome c oxidase subunit 3
MSSNEYYIPEQSKFPLYMSASMFLMLFSFGFVINGISDDNVSTLSIALSIAGLIAVCSIVFLWLRLVIIESGQGKTSAQLQKSFYIGMAWFIFSEVCFFIAFFGVLFYVRNLSVPWLGGEGDRGSSNLLWDCFNAVWPLVQTPDPVQFPPMKGEVSPWGIPLLNTCLLVTSSFFIHWAEAAMHKGERQKMILWLAATLVFGFTFLFFQGLEYHHAWTDLALTLNSGIYGSTFYLLTGFHGMHVTLGVIMVTVVFFRALKGHFNKEDEFGFMAASWYWHFVDVVWIALFIFVYVI